MLLKRFLKSIIASEVGNLNEASMGKVGDFKYAQAVIDKIKSKEKIGFCKTTSPENTKSSTAGEYTLTKDDIDILKKIIDSKGATDRGTKLSNGLSFRHIFKQPFSGATSSKANTALQTNIKELLCIITIKCKTKDTKDLDTDKKILSLGASSLCNTDYAELEKCLKTFDADYCIDHDYIQSAINTANVFLSQGYNPDVYDIERQRSEISAVYYDNAKKFGSGMSDNWNPADIWCIAKKDDKSIGFSDKMYNEFVENLKKAKSDNSAKLAEYNRYFLSQIDHKRILPISLKKISNGGGKCELMVSPNLREVPELQNLSPVKISKVSLMANAKSRKNPVASGFRIDFEDNSKNEFFFQFWEKSDSGFTASLQQADNSDNKSGIDKSYLYRVLKGYDDLTGLADLKKCIVNVSKVEELVKGIKKCENKDLLKSTLDYVKDENNWKIDGTFKPLGIMNKALYTIQNLSVIDDLLSDSDTKILYGMYLYGLKVADDFCPHLKIF